MSEKDNVFVLLSFIVVLFYSDNINFTMQDEKDVINQNNNNLDEKYNLSKEYANYIDKLAFNSNNHHKNTKKCSKNVVLIHIIKICHLFCCNMINEC